MSNASDFVIENGVLKEHVGSCGDVIIPENVNKIGKNAFAGCKKLESVTIPEGVEEIGEYAFWMCENLNACSLPHSLTKIGIGAFRNCFALSEIVIPDAVESIGIDAFFCEQNAVACITANGKFVLHPNGLRRMEVSEETIEKMGATNARAILIQPEMMLAYLQGEFCPSTLSLEKLLISAINLKKNKEFCIEELIKSDDAKAMALLFSVLKKLSLDEIEEIEKNCNKDQRLQLDAFLLQYKQEQFPAEKIVAIEEDKVKRDLGLREKTLAEWRKEFVVKIADNTVSISKYKGNDETVSIPAYIGGHPVVALNEKAFTHCETVKTVYIADGIKTLGWRLFWGCPNVKDIYIPASVSSIGAQAIQGKKRCIHAPAGSYAETYAKENNIPFVAE